MHFRSPRASDLLWLTKKELVDLRLHYTFHLANDQEWRQRHYLALCRGRVRELLLHLLPGDGLVLGRTSTNQTPLSLWIYVSSSLKSTAEQDLIDIGVSNKIKVYSLQREDN